MNILRTTTTYSIAGCTMIIINDAAGAYSPVVDFSISDLSAMGVDNNSNWNLTTTVTFRSNYYNLLVDQWEPLIEMFSFEV